jgi:hypothetical protein
MWEVRNISVINVEAAGMTGNRKPAGSFLAWVSIHTKMLKL